MKLFSKWKVFAAALALGGALLYGSETAPVVASDHDDGETQIKSRNLSLTDLYVFREDWHSGQVAHEGNLILVMNTNPRSLPRQQYFFNTEATYSLHVDRKAADNSVADGTDDIRFDFRFGAPDANSQQTFSLDVVTLDSGGTPVSQVTVTDLKTTPAAPLIGDPNPVAISNPFSVNGQSLNVFAGLREDPFFFDVEQFFKVRAGAAMAGPGGDGPGGGFFDESNSTDFAQGYNVNAIVMRVPISLLQTNGETTFDIWESITLPNDLAGRQ
jgi:Domain of unknown function (DUF4331)